MALYQEQDLYKILERIAAALEGLSTAVGASVSKDGVVQTRDVDRGRVYSEHLGEKLRGRKMKPEPEDVETSSE